MRVYLDTEFNGFGGELISLALVPQNLTFPRFYAACEFHEPAHPWVAQHVIPVLGVATYASEVFKADVQRYMMQLPQKCEIIADWPEDIVHLCNQMCAEGGKQLMVFPTFRLVNTWGGGGVSKIPHNALHDARALRDWYEETVDD